MSKAPKVCMVVFSDYPSDPRVRREAEALLEAGYPVDMICLRNAGQARRETVHGVEVYRLPLRRRRGSKLRYLWEYFAFLVLSFFLTTFLHLRKWYRAVHVHNMPDVLVFSALIPRLTGAKVVIDLHDPMPEVYMTKYDLAVEHPVIRTLIFCEKLSIGFSHLALTPNIAFRDLFLSRSCPKDKLHVIMNSPQESIFTLEDSGDAHPPDQAEEGETFTIMFHGTLVERHGLDTALEALATLRDEIPGLRMEVYGEGDFVKRFLELRTEYDLEEIVAYHGQVSMETIAAAIRHIDLGLIPNKSSTFTDINMPTRIFEYLRMGKPVIAPRTKGILDYFDDRSLNFFTAGNAGSLREAIHRAWSKPEEREAIRRAGFAIYRQHRWENEKRRLVELYGELLDRPNPAAVE